MGRRNSRRLNCTITVTNEQELIEYIQNQLKQIVYKNIGNPIDKQKLVKTCKSMLSAAYKQNDFDIKIVEETEDEKIVREVMEEPEPGIVLQATYTIPTLIQYVSINALIEKL